MRNEDGSDTCHSRYDCSDCMRITRICILHCRSDRRDEHGRQAVFLGQKMRQEIER